MNNKLIRYAAIAFLGLAATTASANASAGFVGRIDRFRGVVSTSLRIDTWPP